MILSGKEAPEIDVHQSLMDSAYKKYQANETWGYNEFITSLDYKEKVAVLTGNLNYQVGNGGFVQWHNNGYSSEADQLIIILEKYKNGHPAIVKALQLVQEAMDTIKNVESAHQQYGRRYDWDDEEEEDTHETLYVRLSPLDDDFYKIDDQFLEEIQEVLKGL